MLINFKNSYNYLYNYKNLISLIYHNLYGSCAKLLALKFSLGSIQKVQKKFGKSLSTGKIEFCKPSNKKLLNPYKKICYRTNYRVKKKKN